uniref:APC membrane recruitment protein 2 n=1 Tax=Nothobranchius kuhntae TaxID=321403 RepID=A0A1A8KUR9_NOTKU
MDVQTENAEPPPNESQPSGKIRKGFKLFGKSKPGNIFSIRSKRDGNNKPPVIGSKASDGSSESPAPNSETDKENGQEVGQGEREQAEDETLGEDGVLASAPARTSISSASSAKSLGFLSLLRGGRRGTGDRRVHTVSQPVGRQRRGLKGLFGNVKFRSKDKEDKEEAPPSPLFMSSRANSVEIIKEDLTLTPKCQPRSLDSPETTSCDPDHSSSTTKSAAMSPSESSATKETTGIIGRANMAPSPTVETPLVPGDNSLSSLLEDISSLLTFDSISGGDIMADVEKEWGKASSALHAAHPNYNKTLNHHFCNAFWFKDSSVYVKLHLYFHNSSKHTVCYEQGSFNLSKSSFSPSLDKIPPATRPATSVASDEMPPPYTAASTHAVSTATPAAMGQIKTPASGRTPAEMQTPAPNKLTAAAQKEVSQPKVSSAPTQAPVSVFKDPDAFVKMQNETSAKLRGAGQASKDHQLVSPGGTGGQGNLAVSPKSKELQTEPQASLQGLSKEKKPAQSKASGLSKIPVVGGGRVGKLPVRESQRSNDDLSRDPPTPVREERPDFYSHEAGSKDKISPTETNAPTSKHSQEESQQLQQLKGLTSSGRDSKIPVKHGTQPQTASQISQSKEPPRTKIPVSKVPVRRAGNKPVATGGIGQTRK